MTMVDFLLLLACLWITGSVMLAVITCIITDPLVGIRKKGTNEPGSDVPVTAPRRRAPGRAEKRQVHR